MGENEFDLVIVGRGYAASTYLYMADLDWCQKILVVAGPDAWASVVRGDGVVNHATYIYARDPKRDGSSDQEPSDRTALKDENEAILDAAMVRLRATREPQSNALISVECLPGIVSEVKRSTILLTEAIARGPNVTLDGVTKPAFSAAVGDVAALYTVKFDQWNDLPGGDWDAVQVAQADREVTAKKVVYCGGAGPHADFYNGKPNALNTDHYVDLDCFMRSPDLATPQNAPRRKVAVLGQNAGIDAAIEALGRNLELYWLISGPLNSRPAWLSTKHYQVRGQEQADAIALADSRIVNYLRSDRFKIAMGGDGGSQYVITFNPDRPGRFLNGDEAPNPLTVDYVVYATGQSAAASENAPGKDFKARIGAAAVLKPILDNEKLQPIYDTNQRFGRYFETVLGLQDKARSNYTGLEVLGAAAFALAPNYARQAYLDQYGTGTRALNTVLQGGAKMDVALKGLRAAGDHDDANLVRLYDYLDDRGSIPSVGDSMMAVLKKLYQQSLGAADQLGTMRHQIEAVTGFDLVTAAIAVPELVSQTERYLKLLRTLQKSLDPFNQAAATQARENVWEFSIFTTYGGMRIAEATTLYLNLLSAEEKQALEDEGFTAGTFVNVLTARDRAVFDACDIMLDITAGDVQQAMLDAIPPLQRSLTNLLAVFTTPNPDAIDYNRMDRTQLAVLLAAVYSSVTVTDWPGMIDFIVTSRGKYPWGYSQGQRNAITVWLTAVSKGTRAATEFPDLDI